MTKRRPLEGLKVIELGQLIAGPFAGKFFAEFGAEVIKVEHLPEPRPKLGEHNEEILARIGYSPAEIAGLRARKIV
jgi:crotonobetainyl-CoA:carnitine CoA-transferase CaiB-like acyl-CoA transferase